MKDILQYLCSTCQYESQIKESTNELWFRMSHEYWLVVTLSDLFCLCDDDLEDDIPFSIDELDIDRITNIKNTNVQQIKIYFGEIIDEEEHFIGALFEYHLQDTIDTTGELDIKLVFHNINVQKERIAGSWEFHFIADGAALAKDTVRIPLNIVVETENGAKVVFQYFSENLLSERIYYGVEGNLNKSVYLIGEDDLGNKVKFLSNVYESNLDGTKGQGFMTPYSMNMITDKTKSLTLTP